MPTSRPNEEAWEAPDSDFMLMQIRPYSAEFLLLDLRSVIKTISDIISILLVGFHAPHRSREEVRLALLLNWLQKVWLRPTGVAKCFTLNFHISAWEDVSVSDHNLAFQAELIGSKSKNLCRIFESIKIDFGVIDDNFDSIMHIICIEN